MKYTDQAPPELEEALELYREFAKRTDLRTPAGTEIRFDGSADDLYGLDYCVYELGFPEEGYRSASLIWAHAIVNLTELHWMEAVGSEFAIGASYEGHANLVFFPHTRLLEVFARGFSQYEGFTVLKDHLLLHALDAEYEPDDLPRLFGLPGCHGTSIAVFANATRFSRLLWERAKDRRRAELGGWLPPDEEALESE